MNNKRWLCCLAVIAATFVAGYFAGGELKPHLNPPVRELVRKNAPPFALPPELIEAIILTESSGFTHALSGKGARGLMQIMPATAQQLSQELKIAFVDDDICRPEINILLGCYYVHTLLRRFQGDLLLTLAAYNTGPTRVQKWLQENPTMSSYDLIAGKASKQTRQFITRVLRRYEERSGMRTSR